MSDIITDTKTITIQVITHGNVSIEGLEYPTLVESGEDFGISYTAINNGGKDSCWGHIKMGATIVSLSRWDAVLDKNGTTTSEVLIDGGITSDATFIIEVGYIK